jgi:hypothetical protein
MATNDPIGFRPTDDEKARIQEHKDRIEELSDYRPGNADILRNALREYLSIDEEGSAATEPGAA